jgi:ribosome-binding protein aMBF1 (putative translation factor)
LDKFLQLLDKKLRKEAIFMPEQQLQDAALEIQMLIIRKRKERGWSQKELGEHIGESEAEVSRAVNGTLTPKAIAVRQKIYSILDIKED